MRYSEEKIMEMLDKCRVDISNQDIIELINSKNDLINRQQAQLADERAKIEICAETISRQDAEIERLTKCQKEEVEKLMSATDKVISEAKAEAIKEFAERLKKRLKGNGGLYSVTTMNAQIDNLVKEMVGEE
jgi:hypothetical protein